MLPALRDYVDSVGPPKHRRKKEGGVSATSFLVPSILIPLTTLSLCSVHRVCAQELSRQKKKKLFSAKGEEKKEKKKKQGND